MNRVKPFVYENNWGKADKMIKKQMVLFDFYPSEEVAQVDLRVLKRRKRMSSRYLSVPFAPERRFKEDSAGSIHHSRQLRARSPSIRSGATFCKGNSGSSRFTVHGSTVQLMFMLFQP